MKFWFGVYSELGLASPKTGAGPVLSTSSDQSTQPCGLRSPPPWCRTLGQLGGTPPSSQALASAEKLISGSMRPPGLAAVSGLPMCAAGRGPCRDPAALLPWSRPRHQAPHPSPRQRVALRGPGLLGDAVSLHVSPWRPTLRCQKKRLLMRRMWPRQLAQRCRDASRSPALTGDGLPRMPQSARLSLRDTESGRGDSGTRHQRQFLERMEQNRCTQNSQSFRLAQR